GIRAWSKLYDAYGKLLVRDGAGGAHALLTHQTPVELVRAYPDAEAIGETGKFAALPNAVVGQQSEPVPLPNSEQRVQHWVDQRWQEKYGRSLWFQFSPAMLSAWYNER